MLMYSFAPFFFSFLNFYLLLFPLDTVKEKKYINPHWGRGRGGEAFRHLALPAGLATFFFAGSQASLAGGVCALDRPVLTPTRPSSAQQTFLSPQNVSQIPDIESTPRRQGLFLAHSLVGVRHPFPDRTARSRAHPTTRPGLIFYIQQSALQT